LNRTYDGDISDYMLNNYNIFALDYYIGDYNDGSGIFFPDSTDLISILSDNYPAAFYFITKAGDFLKYFPDYFLFFYS